MSEGRRGNRFLQAAGCGWLVIAALLVFFAFAAGGASLNLFGIFLPMALIAAGLAAWLFVSRKIVAPVVSLVTSAAFAVFGVLAAISSPSFFFTTMTLTAVPLIVLAVTVLGLWRRSEAP